MRQVCTYAHLPSAGACILACEPPHAAACSGSARIDLAAACIRQVAPTHLSPVLQNHYQYPAISVPVGTKLTFLWTNGEEVRQQVSCTQTCAQTAVI